MSEKKEIMAIPEKREMTNENRQRQFPVLTTEKPVTVFQQDNPEPRSSSSYSMEFEDDEDPEDMLVNTFSVLKLILHRVTKVNIVK